MSIPGFQDLMLPLLKITSDGNEHRIRELIPSLADALALSNAERSELLPSGKQARFDNRISWSSMYLTRAGLLRSVKRGVVQITDRGRQILLQQPARIDLKFLRQFPEYQQFISPNKPANGNEDGSSELTLEEPTQTPLEALESNYQRLRHELASELLETIKQCSPAFFERLVVDLLLAMGYGGSRKDAGKAIGQSGDGGVDGIIKEDRLGLDVVCIQAKRWEATVGRPIVQAFAGSLEGQRARKGVLITTSRFSHEAQTYVSQIEKKIVLIDGEQLAQYMIDFGIGVAELASYTIKRLDSDYFEEGFP